MSWAATQPRTTYLGDQMSFRIEVNPSVIVTQRSLYSFLDFLRDVGGLAFIVTAFAAMANYMFTFNVLENLMVAELYRKPETWKTAELASMSGTKTHHIEGDKTLDPHD